MLLARIDRYPDIGSDVKTLSEFSAMNKAVDFVGRLIYDDNGREVINFGKYKGRLAEEVLTVEPSYYDRIMRSDFASSTQKAFTAVMDRVKAARNTSSIPEAAEGSANA